MLKLRSLGVTVAVATAVLSFLSAGSAYADTGTPPAPPPVPCCQNGWGGVPGFTGWDYQPSVPAVLAGTTCGAYRYHWLQNGCYNHSNSGINDGYNSVLANDIKHVKGTDVTPTGPRAGGFFELFVSLDQLFCKANTDPDPSVGYTGSNPEMQVPCSTSNGNDGAWNATTGYNHSYSCSSPCSHYFGYDKVALQNLDNALGQFHAANVKVDLVAYTWQNYSAGAIDGLRENQFHPEALDGQHSTMRANYLTALQDFLAWMTSASPSAATDTDAIGAVDLFPEAHYQMDNAAKGYMASTCSAPYDSSCGYPTSIRTDATNHLSDKRGNYSASLPSPCSQGSQSCTCFSLTSSPCNGASGSPGCQSIGTPNTSDGVCVDVNIVWPFLKDLYNTAHTAAPGLIFDFADTSRLLTSTGGTTTCSPSPNQCGPDGINANSQQWWEDLLPGDAYNEHLYSADPWDHASQWSSGTTLLLPWYVSEADCQSDPASTCEYDTNGANCSADTKTNCGPSVVQWWLDNLPNYGALDVIAESNSPGSVVDSEIQGATTSLTNVSQPYASVSRMDFDGRGCGAVSSGGGATSIVGRGRNQFTGSVNTAMNSRLWVHSGSTSDCGAGTTADHASYSPPNSLRIDANGGGKAYLYDDYNRKPVLCCDSTQKLIFSFKDTGFPSTSPTTPIAQVQPTYTDGWTNGTVRLLRTSTGQLQLKYQDGSGTQHAVSCSGSCSLDGGWHMVELKVEAPSGGTNAITVTLDGTAVIARASYNLGSPQFTSFSVGAISLSSDPGAGSSLYFDEVNSHGNF